MSALRSLVMSFIRSDMHITLIQLATILNRNRKFEWDGQVYSFKRDITTRKNTKREKLSRTT